MNSFHENLSTGTASQETGPAVEPQINLDRRALRNCCAKNPSEEQSIHLRGFCSQI
jgi:hypothetical protein